MKRWPILLAIAAILLAVGIGLCAVPEETRPASHVREPATVDAPQPELARPVEPLSATDASSDAAAPARAAVESAADSSSLVLELQTSKGAPVPHARFVIARGEVVLDTRKSEADGRASFPPLGRDVDVFALLETTVRARQHLDDAVGTHVPKIPAGVSLRGIVLVDDAPPKEPLSLSLSLLSRDETVGLEPPPTFVQRQIDFRGYEGRPSLAVMCDAAGRFEFGDLPPSWVGTLDGPYEYLWESDGPIEITDLSREVVVRLRRPPVITGRVWTPDRRKGAANALGSYEIEEGNGFTTGEFLTDAAGVFAVRVPPREMERFTATIALAGVGRCDLELKKVPATGMDVGDIVLEPARDVYFVARDREGKPIAGALASTFDETPLVSGPTDGEGRGTLPSVPPTTDMIRIVALGYRSVTRGVNIGEATKDAPLEVTMERVPHLELAIELRDGTPAGEVIVHLSCRGTAPFITGEDGDGSRPIQLDLGAPQPGMRRTRAKGAESEYELRYRVDISGRLRIPGLNPDARLVARVEDLTGEVLAERDIDPTLIGSSAPCRIVIDGVPRGLELLVLDPERKPIRGAKVFASMDGFQLGSTLSDGIIVIGPIYAMKVAVRVEAAGLFPSRLDEVWLSHELERREVVMSMGHTVHVRVVDAGAAVPIEGVGAKLESQRVGKITRCVIDDECFRIDELPPTPVELSAFVAGVRLQKEHDPRDPVAEFALPEHGSLLVEFSEPLALPSQFVVVVAPRPNPDGSASANAEMMRTIASERPTTSFELPVVFAGQYSVQVKEMNPAAGTEPLRSRTDGVTVRAGERTVVRASLSR